MFRDATMQVKHTIEEQIAAARETVLAETDYKRRCQAFDRLVELKQQAAQ